MKPKDRQIIVYKGKIGIVLKYESEDVFRFASIENKPSYMKDKETFPVISSEHAREATDGEKDTWIMIECEWLGKSIKVHKIGEYQIVEYIDSDTGNSCFSSLINYESTNHSYGSLDSAIVGCIAYKHEGCNHRADQYFMKMIRKDSPKVDNAQDYKGYIIKSKRDFGEYGFLINGKRVREGFLVVDKRNINVMPGATWFQTIEKAKKGIDVLIKYGEKNFWKGLKTYKLEASLNENKR